MVSDLYPDLKKSYSDSKYCQKLDFIIHAYMLKDFFLFIPTLLI